MRFLLVFALLALGVSSVGASQQTDEAEIGRIQARWDDAWNRHDIKALSALVAEDDADGTHRSPRNGVMMQVLVKRSGAWTIVAVQNTNVR